MLRRDAVTGLAAVVVLLLTGCTGPAEAEKPDLVIAASLELTGGTAEMGVIHERALRLRVDQLNAADTLGGRKIRLIVADNRSDANEAQGQVSRWAADASVSAVIVGSCGPCGVAAVNVANDKTIPMISLAPTSEVSSPVANRRFAFKVGPNAPDDARALVRELLGAGVKNVGVVAPDDGYGANGREAMTQETQKVGIKITGLGTFAPNTTNFGVPAAAALAGNKPPDAVVVWAYPAQSGQVATALRGAGYQGRVFFDAIAAGNLFITAAGTDGASMVFTQTLAMDDVIATSPAKAAQKQWFEDYTSRYGSYHGYASFGADALQLIVEAVEQSGSTDRVPLRNTLETTQIDGLSGPLRFSPGNHSALSSQALTVLIARSGRWRLLG